MAVLDSASDVSAAEEDLPAARRDETVNSFANGLRVIALFGSERRPMTLSDVAERSDLTRATARRILLTLQSLGYVSCDERYFSLTAKVLELGYAYLNSQGIAELALPALQALSARINESCSMSVLEGKDIVYIARVPTRRIMTISLGVGARLPAFATSMGRILLGALDDEALASTLTDMDRPKYTPHTQTDVGTLTGLIREGQRQGWIITRQELELGLASIAVPVFRRNGEIAAAINVGVQARADVEDYLKATILPALRETAATLSRALTQRVG